MLTTEQWLLKNYLEKNFRPNYYFSVEEVCNNVLRADGTPIYKLNTSACRFVYNLYIQENEKAYKEGKKFISAYNFNKWFNNESIPNHEEMRWLKEASSKAIKQTILNCESAFKKFFKGLGGKPKFKKPSIDKTGYYFVKNSNIQIIKHERNKVKVPCFGWVTFKEINYFLNLLPTQIHISKRFYKNNFFTINNSRKV